VVPAMAFCNYGEFCIAKVGNYALQFRGIILCNKQVEKIIGDALPPSAYKYRAWWGNGGHSQANAWLNAGWRVDKIKLRDSILFAKNSE
jgi:hypothetical protein